MSDVEDIKSRLTIEQVISGYIPIKKAGRVYKALCPFHNEKTPSFTINPERGIFKCFGCGEGGDIFDFIMKIEGLDFPETLELLANKAGITLEKKTGSFQGVKNNPNTVSKGRLFAVNEYCAKLWHTILTKHPGGAPAREYLEHRKLNQESIENFEIGYAPYGNTTRLSLEKTGFKIKEVQGAGDPTKMQDRITFPISDLTGKIIGFTGRILELKDDPNLKISRGPKYWNTPETDIFYKSKAVYGIHLAKRRIQDEDLAILVEGQMDVIMLHQHNYKNAVASSGTALTEQQLLLIKRFSHNVAFAYDQDKAGIEATKKGLEMALHCELNPYVITIPAGKDPAEALISSPEKWEKAYQDKVPYMEWLINHYLPNVKTLDPSSKKEVAKNLVPWLNQIIDPIEKAEWLKIVAYRIQTSEENLRSALRNTKTEYSIQEKSLESDKTETPVIKSTPLQQHLELALALMVSYPQIIEIYSKDLTTFELTEQTYFTKLVNKILKSYLTKTEDTNFERFLADNIQLDEKKQLDIKLTEILQNYEKTGLDQGIAIKEYLTISNRIKNELKETQKKKIELDIKTAEANNDQEEITRLFKDLQNLI